MSNPTIHLIIIKFIVMIQTNKMFTHYLLTLVVQKNNTKPFFKETDLVLLIYYFQTKLHVKFSRKLFNAGLYLKLQFS